MQLRVASALRSILLTLVVLACAILPSHASAAEVLLAGFPLLKQQHTLTCESSAVSMGTRGLLSETQLMSVIPRNPNPNFGFRGNPDGPTGGVVDYGVYAAPLRTALLRYGYQSDVMLYSSNDQIASYLSRGWPVVVWVTFGLQTARPRLAQYGGVNFILVPHEHALLATGYDAQTILAQDPFTGQRVRYRWARFDRSWGLFGNMALAIQPCALPQPVPSLRVASSTAAEIKWSWGRAVNATRYRVSIVRHGTPDVTLYGADQTTRHASLLNPQPGAQYEVAVQALSSCGAPATPVRLIAQVIAKLPTATSTPLPTSAPTGTAQPTATPTPSVTPAATSASH